MLKAITARVSGGIHESLHLFQAAVKIALKNVHQIAIKYLTNLVLNKQKLDAKQTPVLSLSELLPQQPPKPTCGHLH